MLELLMWISWLGICINIALENFVRTTLSLTLIPLTDHFRCSPNTFFRSQRNVNIKQLNYALHLPLSLEGRYICKQLYYWVLVLLSIKYLQNFPVLLAAYLWYRVYIMYGNYWWVFLPAMGQNDDGSKQKASASFLFPWLSWKGWKGSSKDK